MKVPDTNRVIVASTSKVPSVGTPFQTADFLSMLLKSDDAFFLSHIVEKDIAGVACATRKNEIWRWISMYCSTRRWRFHSRLDMGFDRLRPGYHHWSVSVYRLAVWHRRSRLVDRRCRLPSTRFCYAMRDWICNESVHRCRCHDRRHCFALRVISSLVPCCHPRERHNSVGQPQSYSMLCPNRSDSDLIISTKIRWNEENVIAWRTDRNRRSDRVRPEYVRAWNWCNVLSMWLSVLRSVGQGHSDLEESFSWVAHSRI